MRLIHHPDAEAEMIAAARYYEEKVATLGGQVLDAVDRGMRSIEGSPERF